MNDNIYSAFDPAALGAGLDLTQTNTILTVAETTDVNRCARALYGKSKGTWNAEFLVWGQGALTGYSSVGLVDAAASLTTYVGGDAHGWGLRIAEGLIVSNDATLATVATSVAGNVIGVSLTFDESGNGSVTWSNSTGVLSTQALPPGTYYLAATVAGVMAGDLQCMLNTGQRGFENAPMAGGWYISAPLLDSVYIASGEYITAPSDDPASTPFDSAILGAQSFAVARQLNFDVWGGSSVVPATSSLQIQNPGGEYEALIGELSGRPVILQELDSEDSAYSTATASASMVVAGVTASGESTLNIALKDAISLLDLPLQNHLILPNAEADAVNQPWPICVGGPRTVPLTLLDAQKCTYAVSDIPIVGFGYIRDKGDALDPNASPPDYTISTDRRTVTLGSQAQGIVTADISTIGGGTEPTSATDIFGGAGNPFVGTVGSAPTGWQQKTGWGTTAPLLRAGGIVEFGLTSPSLLLSSGVTILSGRSYRLTLTVVAATSGSIIPASQAVRIGIAKAKNGALFWQVGGVPGTYSTIVTNAGADFEPIFAVFDDSSFQSPKVKISGVSMLLIADTYVPSATLPCKLADFVDAIMALASRNGVRIPYSRADAEAIDAATGYAGIGYAAIGATTARQALTMALASYCACAWMDATGTIRFTRLAIPEDETATISIDASDRLGDMTYAPDFMTGLTTQVGYRKNWVVLKESDFVTDFIDVPPSLRRAMSRDYQGVKATAATLSATYARAVFAKPLVSLLDKPEDAQDLADYFGRLARTKRGFRTIDLPHGTVSLGVIANVTYPRFGLNLGKNLQVVTILERQLKGIDTVTFWG